MPSTGIISDDKPLTESNLMFCKVFEIDYDTDGDDVDLPTSGIVELDDDADPEQDLADAISDATGWCVNSLCFELLPADFVAAA